MSISRSPGTCAPSLSSTLSSSHPLLPASTLPRSTTSSEWRFGWSPVFPKSWAQTACWKQGSQAFRRRQPARWTRGFPCQTPVLPPTEQSVDLRFCWEHHDSASRLGLGRWANSCSASFTTVPTGARSTWGTITSLSLWARKLDVQSISRSDEYGETRCVVFKQKEVESSNVFRQSRFLQDIDRFLGELWTFLQLVFTQEMLRNLFLMGTQITCLLKQVMISWSKTVHWFLFTHPWNERIEESSGIASRRILCPKIERNSWYDTAARFTNTELQDRANCMSDSGNFHEKESICSETLSDAPSQPAVVQVLERCRAATKACVLIHGICVGHRKTLLAIHVLSSIHHRHRIKEFFTLRVKVPQLESQCRDAQGDLSPEVKNELGAQFQCRRLQEGRQPWILSLPAEIPQNSVAVQQWLQISELQFDKFPTPCTLSCWRIRPGEFLCWYSLESHVMDQSSGDSWFSGWI